MPLKADALPPKALFDSAVHYEIPVFQRPYVWSEVDQWAPLWEDVQRVVLKVLDAGEDPDALERVGGHFLGAIVFKSKPASSGDVTRHSVIDGQQRTTTLQLLLDAAQKVFETLGYVDDAEALNELTFNSANRFRNKPDRLKLWPSRLDRDAFAAVMDAADTTAFGDHRVVQAHNFFKSEIHAWITDTNSGAVGDELQRVRALTDVLQSRLYVVAINLSGHDDSQLIFETLNDRGTPLLKADLVKNWVFQQGERLRADIENWPEKFWSEFDDEWWREEVAQGRHLRSRIDTFLQYWLTMRTRNEVLTDDTFRRFVEYAEALMTTVTAAEGLLSELLLDARKYRELAQKPSDTAAGRFHRTVVQEFELAATTPLLLWIISDNHKIPEDQITIALSALESWVIRRTLLRYTMKDVNKTMVSILSMFDKDGADKIGTLVRGFLTIQTADARLWPTDSELVERVPELRMYANIRQNRLRVVLERIEQLLRTKRHESVTIAEPLQIEHVMPQKWRKHWDENPSLDDAATRRRDSAVNTLGNLTLVTQGLNGSLSHRPWTDSEAVKVAPTGKEAGRGKRSLLSKFSVLVLNKEIIDRHAETWTESDINNRSVELAKSICEAWPGPNPIASTTP
ncbi:MULTISPECIES: DUF262 domain-containing HNH endonuclease family protein [unclassified Rhodococcus (in: high G+C Gram-positive bacteria)]|uniref:DUF262 domain-containing protein n=1 Tax=unclassified Rhodococcus (in: high G+C Gram-positive bacteria) TaxID=192944 RepID=UPI0033973414